MQRYAAQAGRDVQCSPACQILSQNLAAGSEELLQQGLMERCTAADKKEPSIKHGLQPGLQPVVQGSAGKCREMQGSGGECRRYSPLQTCQNCCKTGLLSFPLTASSQGAAYLTDCFDLKLCNCFISGFAPESLSPQSSSRRGQRGHLIHQSDHDSWSSSKLAAELLGRAHVSAV